MLTRTISVGGVLWVVAAGLSHRAYAEDSRAPSFRCRSDVRYTWRKPDEEKEREVYWTRVEESGAEEAAAKESLSRVVEVEKERARQQCSEDHENQSSCLSAKFVASEPVRNTLSFGARKSFEEAIVTDCASLQGVCGEVRTTEAVCLALGSSKDAAAEATPEAEKGKTDSKKKKK